MAIFAFFCLVQAQVHLKCFERVYQVQETASAAVEWCRTLGGRVPARGQKGGDLVTRVAQLAAGGNCPANAERDMHSVLKLFSKRVGAPLSTVRARPGSNA